MTTVEFLGEWALRSSILILSGALLLRALRVEDSSIRLAAWVAMLAGSLAMPALTSALPKTFLPAIRRTAAGVVIRPLEVPVAVSEPVRVPAPAAPIVPVSQYSEHSAKPEPPAVNPFDWAIDWRRPALMVYAATCGAMLLRICAGLLVGLRLLGRSFSTGKTTEKIEIRESAGIVAPLTLGIVRPAIVLPLDWRDWDSTKFEAVLAHERSHIQRRDPWVQLLSAIHRALLWISPLSWFLHQRIVQTAEDASDDAAVAAIHDRAGYAEALLHFMQRGVWKADFVGVSMARHGSPEKRIRRVLNSSTLSGGVTGRGVAAIVAVMSPLAYVIATAQVRPQFDIADIHASTVYPGVIQSMNGGGIRAGRYRIQTATMVDLIKTAYGVDADKVLGGPSWLELDRYDVFAKAPDSTSNDAARLMLQALLADRFKLVLHKDSRLVPAFALAVMKGGTPKLKKADGSGSIGCKWTPRYTDAEIQSRGQALREAGQTNYYIQQTHSYACQNMTMAAFAEQMQSMIGLPYQYFNRGAVVDRTGLSGAWDFNFKYTSKPPPYAVASGIDGETISIFDAMEKQLGLKLEATKIPAPFIVVDSVNRKPTENLPDANAILHPPPPAEFEVADLRLSDPNARETQGRGYMPGGRFEVRNYPLRTLIQMGWDVALTGAPAWLNSTRVDLTAKLPSTSATREITGVVDYEAFHPALKALLTERFKVAIHMEQRPVPGYALVAVKPKMQKADPSRRTKCFEGPGADKKDPRVSNPLLSRLVTCQNITMQEFAKQLQFPGLALGYIIRTEVLDATGIEGAYDFTLSFSAARATPAQAATGTAAGQPVASDPDGLTTIFDALEKQLGLKLEKRDIPTPFAVLDHVEAKPAEN